MLKKTADGLGACHTQTAAAELHFKTLSASGGWRMEQFVLKVQRQIVQCKEKSLIYLQRSSCLRGISLEELRRRKEEVGSQDIDFFGDLPLESSVITEDKSQIANLCSPQLPTLSSK